MRSNIEKNTKNGLKRLRVTTKWKSDNFMESNREKPNIAIAILEN